MARSAMFLIFAVVSLLAIVQGVIVPSRPMPSFDDLSTSALTAQLFDYSPKWAPTATGSDHDSVVITITGCGFNAYSSAVCVFDWGVSSSTSIISSDAMILCE